jgi:hypothetical protein
VSLPRKLDCGGKQKAQHRNFDVVPFAVEYWHNLEPNMQRLTIADDLLDPIIQGKKTCTIRKDKREIDLGQLEFMTVSGGIIEVEVTEVVYKRFGHLRTYEANLEGLPSSLQLKILLKKFYPDIQDDDVVTIVVFQNPSAGGHFFNAPN